MTLTIYTVTIDPLRGRYLAFVGPELPNPEPLMWADSYTSMAEAVGRLIEQHPELGTARVIDMDPQLDWSGEGCSSHE